jgi:hypothetical protein
MDIGLPGTLAQDHRIIWLVTLRLTHAADFVFLDRQLDL